MVEDVFTSFLSNLDVIGSWASIIGVLIAIAAVIIAIFIFKKTRKIETRQRENAEGLYVEKTNEDLNKIQYHYDEVFRIVENHEIEDENEKELATTELNLHYRKYHGEMTKLQQRSERDLELWISLEHAKRNKFDKIIANFDWLTNKFFPLNVTDEEMRIKIWTAQYKTFLEKKYEIDDILKEQKTEA